MLELPDSFTTREIVRKAPESAEVDSVEEVREQFREVIDENQAWYLLDGIHRILVTVTPIGTRDGVVYSRILTSLGGSVFSRDVPKSELDFIKFRLPT